MRVGFDTSPLAQTGAGTARHVRGLMGALAGRSGLELVVVSAGGAGKLASLRRDALWYPLRLGAVSRRLDLLHCTTFRAPLRPRCPLVVTVHDLAVMHHPEAFPYWHRTTGAAALRASARVADVVVAVSETVAGETEELLGIPRERIVVVPNGVDPVFRPDGPREEGGYVLAVGTLEPRKNLVRIAEAAVLAGKSLRVAGAEGWGRVQVPGWVGRPSDGALAALYRGADCLVFASLHEGFGIPVLEAMACGTPVVTSRGGALEEVAGGAAVLVDPFDPVSIAAGIRDASARRDALSALGRARAAAFTWEAAADRVEALWRRLA
ncbi:MAG: glycosyltransferase family 1 protein [Thermoleophilia bacterium]|nr:glycosyltransferase family 1 protein [Thermoleophilia bacterium]